MDLLGKWKKISKANCSDKYPDTLEFKTGGLFEGASPPGSAIHPVWDVGTYKVAKSRITLSASNDALISYDFVLQEKTLVVKDAEGCTVKFQRVG